MDCAMTPLEIQIENYFSRKDLEFIKCPICTKPLLKQACEERQKAFGHYKIEEGEEQEAVSLRYARCEGCEHYDPPERRPGKMKIAEINRKVHGFKKPARRIETTYRTPEMRSLHGSSVFKANKEKFAWREKTKSKWSVK
jgi:hypothetical protein